MCGSASMPALSQMRIQSVCVPVSSFFKDVFYLVVCLSV